MSNQAVLRSYNVPMTEFDIVIFEQEGRWRNLSPILFGEIHEINIVETRGNEVLHNGEPRIFIQPIRGWHGGVGSYFMYPPNTAKISIPRTAIVGICCPSCWQAGEFTSVENPTLIGLVVDDKMYRICERCGYHKRA